MKKIEYNELEAKFKQLPHEIQLVLTDSGTADQIDSISKQFGLHIDEESVLYDLTTYTLLGLVPASEFVNTLTKETSVKRDDAQKIAEEINTKVFQKIKSTLRENQEESEKKTSNDISNVEKAGNFEVMSSASQTKEEKISKNNVLSAIENPVPSKEVKFPKSETFTEPLVDHLLNSSAARPAINEKIQETPTHHTAMPPQNLPTSDVSPVLEPKTPPVQTKPAEAPKKSGPDMYREVIG